MTVIVALVSIVIVFPVCMIINRYTPFIKGDKAAYNKISKKIGLKIRW